MALVSKAFGDIITFTRASTGSYFDSAGVLQSAATNAPRLDYNPSTLAAQGLLIEEQRTNGIRNNTMVGAVAGTPGTLPTNWSVVGAGLTANVIGTGVESGINYVDIQLVGTTASTSAGIRFELTNQTTAASGQSWSGSFYLRIVSGSITNFSDIRLNIFGRTAANAANTDNSFSADFKASLTAASLSQARRTYSGALADATTAFVSTQLLLGYASGAAIDITLRIGLPQLEQGAFATSVIPTSTVAVTRSADVASVNTLSPWYNATEGTLYAEWATAANDATNNRGIAALDDGSNNNRVATFLPSSFTPLAVSARVVSGGTATSPANAGSIALSSTAKTALTYGIGTNQAALCVNGGTPTTASPVAAPVGVNTLRIGAILGVTQLGGHLRRITYYPRRLTSAELQTITT